MTEEVPVVSRIAARLHGIATVRAVRGVVTKVLVSLYDLVVVSRCRERPRADEWPRAAAVCEPPMSRAASSSFATDFSAPLCQLRVRGAPSVAHGPPPCRLREWWGAGTVPPSCAARQAAWQVTCGKLAVVESRVVRVASDAAWRSRALNREMKTLRSHMHHLRRCARLLLANGSIERHARVYETPLTPLLSHAYLIHHTVNKQRRAFQLAQLPRLGLPFSIVRGYDASVLDEHVRTCLLPPKRDEADMALREHLWVPRGRGGSRPAAQLFTFTHYHFPIPSSYGTTHSLTARAPVADRPPHV